MAVWNTKGSPLDDQCLASNKYVNKVPCNGKMKYDKHDADCILMILASCLVYQDAETRSNERFIVTARAERSIRTHFVNGNSVKSDVGMASHAKMSREQ